MAAKKMTFWEHVDELRDTVINIFLIFFGIFIFSFVVGFQEFEVLGSKVLILYPTISDNISSWFFNQITSDLLPSRVELITVTPVDAIVANLQISIFLAVVVGMPFMVYQISNFIGPGLYPRERRMVLTITFPATGLFILGCLISYFLITPFTLDFLYSYSYSMKAHPFLSVSEFISFILAFTFIFGFIFELPIIMIGVTLIGVVSPEFWKKHWRAAFVVFIFIGAIITPDGSGITQMMVAIPMMILYVVGYFASKHYYRKIKVI
ncbi:MAG: twin-arginine translocase subunit TatC [Thermoplasmata archaeon]|nr:twin-arginine translocase subunit TatC [Thermoplasmata archaeon]